MAMSKSGIGSAEDRTRFLRLVVVIVDELTPILRDLLHHEIHPNDISNQVTQKGLKNLNANQWDIIINAATQGYKNFDITLLYTLLRNICQHIPHPTQYWGVNELPKQNETTVGDDIERIRIIKNSLLSHYSEVAMSKTEFQNYWSIISDICKRMQTRLNKNYVRMLQESKDCTIDSDTESKYMKIIKELAEEERTTKDLLQKVLTETGLTSKENLKIEAKDGNKRPYVETLTDVGIDIMKEMVKTINKMTSESEIDQLYESIEDFLKATKEEIENMDLENFFTELKEKITSYAKLQTANGMRILAKFSKFILRLKKDYRAYLECSRGSLILLMTFSSKRDYDCYKKDLENGEIGKEILQLFLYPPFLASFGLKVEDLVVLLNDRLLTQETALHEMSEVSDQLTYETYLHLDKVLDSQHLESEKCGERVDEEHLFIIVHQAFEIWFKQILEDFGGIIRTYQNPDFDDRKHLALIITKLDRTSRILKLVVQHFEIIETMPPAVFLNFRKYLRSGSGFQSLQFCLIENTLGLLPEARSAGKGQGYKEELTEKEKGKAKSSEGGPTLFTVIEDWLRKIFETCTGGDPGKYLNELEKMVKTWSEDTNLDEHHRGDKDAFAKVLKKESYQKLPERRLSFEAFHGALLISLYQDEPEFQMAYKTMKLIMDVDAGVSKWRHNHVLMVHRMIGNKPGTGGSSGYDYLKSTNQDKYRVFIEFFHLGAFLIPKDYKIGQKPYSVPQSGKISSSED